MVNYIGTPTSRVDGHAKVTGAAKYAADFNVAGLIYGSVVSSRIAKGRVRRIDATEALSVVGVVEVLTHANRPAMAHSDQDYKDDVAPEGSPFRPLYDDKVRFSGQPIALVLAEEPEIARFAASLIRVEYAAEPHATDLFAHLDQGFELSEDTFALTPAKPRGDAPKAFAQAEVGHRGEYFVPVEHHNPMELYASTVIWEGGGKLTVYDKTQGVQNVQRYLCSVFALKSEELRVVSPARALKRSVRLVLTRQEMYALCYRPATIARLGLGAKRTGSLDAITHEAIAVTSQHEEFARKDTIWAGALYACPNTKFAHKLVHLDMPTPSDMRAPGAATGVYALECAMDELAVALKLDPLELRYRNYSDRDQNADVPFTSKKLRECYRQGAEAFGWAKRNPEPRSMRDGRDLVGWGMASGVWEALQMETAARIVLTANGHAEIACATSDIGTGTYTIMAQVAADM